MKKSMKKFNRKFFWFFVTFLDLVLSKTSYLHATGWIKSLRLGYPCDIEGNKLPWMNYAVVNLLKERLHDDLSLFEFGSGYSTVFYSGLVKSVVSLEHNSNWFEYMQQNAPDNVTSLYKEQDIDGNYCRGISECDQEFDVIIVDGRDRVNCLKQGIEKLSRSGVVILDDSERERYQDGIDYAKAKGFRVLHMEGLKPTGFKVHRSTIIYRDGNCLNL